MLCRFVRQATMGYAWLMAGKNNEMLLRDGETIAYLKRAGAAPGIVWLGGFKSEMTATKATALDGWAARTRHTYVRFDYFGHGASTGDFRHGTVTRWREDALAVIDELTTGRQILVGSSMGAWLALLAALARPQRIAALLLIAPAVDFTETLLWQRLDETMQNEIMTKGEWLRPTAYGSEPYAITRKLIEDGRGHLLLGRAVALSCPVRIVQGMEDPDVPWMHALKLVEALGPDTQLTLVKNGDHRLSKPHELALIEQILSGLVAPGDG
jgi:pimeloyl-ACP methyl ester carboxylesterase